MYIYTNEELIHYGVKGMKWGVRKDRLSATGKAIRKKGSQVRNTYRNITGSRASAARSKYRKKNIDGMSDKDLQKAVNRMNLEKQYRDLTKSDYMRGERFLKNSLKYTTTLGAIKKIVTKAVRG